MLSGIMSKCKKQCYGKSMCNINSSNDKKQWVNNNGEKDNNDTYAMSAVGGKSFDMSRRKRSRSKHTII
eukprot:8753592-Ditylum_brightwellii.AAC.1